MAGGLRLAALRDRLGGSLWPWPTVSIVVAVVAGELLSGVAPAETAGTFARFGGTPEGARAILSTVAGSTITVTGVTFSLTVVALQMASTQFTPRLLGTFLSDRGNQAVLSAFLATFAYTLVVLRRIRIGTDAAEGYVPDLAVGIGLLLTFFSVGMLVYFFHHLTQQLRLENVLAELSRDTLAAVQHAQRDEEARERELPEVPASAVVLRARRSGYLQAVRLDGLLEIAQRHGVVIRLLPAVGLHVTCGTTLGWAWPVDPSDGDTEVDADALARVVHYTIHLGIERTLTEDVAFGIRQLVDIAARALSPGVNDPTTAVAAIDTMATVVSDLASRSRPVAVLTDERGRARAAIPQSSFGELLALACDQPRRYGRTEPAVLTELLRMLTDVAENVVDDAYREAIANQIDATVERARDAELSANERARVDRYARQARAACRRGERVARFEAEEEGDEEGEDPAA